MEASITMNMLTVISNLLIIMSSSSNFFVYLCKDHKFLVILNRCVSASVESSFGDSTCPVMRQDTVVSKYVTFHISTFSGERILFSDHMSDPLSHSVSDCT